jgi:hypothetical protein
MALRLALILAISALAACDDGVGFDGSLVGGPCIDSSQCDFRCETGGEYPQGMCTRPCNVDGDCPDDTFCINREGGICMLGCALPSDCRGGYNCEGRENRGHGGDSLVCSN